MHEQITDHVFLVGGSRFSDGNDCLVYLVNAGDLVLIDTGVGPSWPTIRGNITDAGFDATAIHTLILTHCHIDHIGAADRVIAESGCRVVAHALDTKAIEAGDSRKTAASWYNIDPPKIEVTHPFDGDEETLELTGGQLRLIHTPGHTPGSFVVLWEESGQKVLFGQDIHGPFVPDFGSDIGLWRESMERLLELEADILCEGHYGVYRTAAEVRNFIEAQLASH